MPFVFAEAYSTCSSKTFYSKEQIMAHFSTKAQHKWESNFLMPLENCILISYWQIAFVLQKLQLYDSTKQRALHCGTAVRATQRDVMCHSHIYICAATQEMSPSPLTVSEHLLFPCWHEKHRLDSSTVFIMCVLVCVCSVLHVFECLPFVCLHLFDLQC